MRARPAVVGLIVAVAAFGGIPAGASEAPEYITVWEAGGLSPSTLEGVRVSAAIERAEVAVRRSGSLRLMGVTRGDADVQRPDTGFGYPMATLAVEQRDPSVDPEVTAALGPDAVVMSARSAALRGAEVGDNVEIEGWNRQILTLRIAAIVPDDRTDWYEIVTSAATADRLGFDREASAVVWGRGAASVPLRLEWFTSSPYVRIGSPSDPVVFTDATLPTVVVKERFGEFSFRPTGVSDGIQIEEAWLDANIVDVFIPRLGPFRCNRAVVPYIRAAVDEMEAIGVADEIDFADFQAAGGCFNSRMMRGSDQGFALSRHAWGIAIDFNPSTNRFGGETNLSADFGEVMRRWGFSWGSTWTIPDGMHFEWVRVPDSIEVCAPMRIVSGDVFTVEATSDACAQMG